MPALLTQAEQTAALRAAVARQHGFISPEQIAEMALPDSPHRLTSILVRCGACRFVCGAQDVARLIRGVEATGDYVRDCSLPVGEVIR